jgi:hypothetical protein
MTLGIVTGMSWPWKVHKRDGRCHANFVDLADPRHIR